MQIYYVAIQHSRILQSQSGTWLLVQIIVHMQDNDQKLASKLCHSYIKSKEEQHVFQLMTWPAQITHLNLIELIWDDLDQNFRAKQPTSVDHLW